MAEWAAAALVEAGWTGATAAGVTTAFTYASYAYVAYSIMDAQNQQRKAKDAANASMTDRLVTVRSSNAARRIIYGRSRVAADTIAYVCQHGSRREYVTFVLPLAGHEVESIDDIWFNDQSIGALDGSGYVTGGAYFRTAETIETETVTGGAIGATVTLAHIPTNIMSVSGTIPLSIDEGGNTYEQLHEGIDFSKSGATVTWLTTQTGKTLVWTYRWNTTAQLVQVKRFLGIAAGETDSDLQTNSGGQWTIAHNGHNVARLHVTLQYDNDIFGSVGVPNITAIVKGKKVYNWVTGATAWSSNAALCLADYLTSSEGFGISSSRINTSMMQTAQALCDEWVPSWGISYDASGLNIDGPPKYVGETVRFYTTGSLPSPLATGTTYYIKTVVRTATTGGVYVLSATLGGAAITLTNNATGTNLLQQRRYTVDGQVSTEANLRDNLKLLAGAMSGKAIYSGGEWRIKGGAYVSPVATLDEADLADGAISILPNPRRSDLFNGVRGTFPDPQNLYQTSSFAPYLSSTYAAIDGSTIVADVSLPLTQDGMRAQRIAKRMLFEHRSSLSISANWKLSTFMLQTGDTVYVKIARYGWDAINSGLGKIFIVGERKLSPTGTIQMALIETSSAIDAWDYSEATNPDPAPNTTLADPRYVAKLAGVAFHTSAVTFTVLNDGTIIPYGELTWTAIGASSVLQGGRIEVLWKRAPEISWQTIKLAPDETSARIFPVSAGETINVQINVYNGAGSKSDVLPATFICSTDLPTATNISSAYGNLVSGSELISTVQWSLGIESGATDSFTMQRPSLGVIPGSPSNISIIQVGTQNKYAFAGSKFFPAVPGTRYCFYAGIVAHRSSARANIAFYDANGVYLSGEVGATLTTDETKIPASAADYRTSGGFSTAPAGAVSGAINLVKFGTSTGSGSIVYFTQPFVAPVSAGLGEFPPWNAGVSPDVGYAQIVDESATKQLFKELAVSGELSWYGATARVCVITFTAEVTCTANLIGTVSVSQRQAASLAYWKFSYTDSSPSQLKDVGGKLTVDVGTDTADPTFWLAKPSSSISLPASFTSSGSRTIGLVAGRTYSIGITVVNDGDFVIISANPNTIDYASLRIEQIRK